MNVIDQVKIENLWGPNAPITINFDKKYNFLVGRNGSGKTTIINLITAVLTADFGKLDKVDFSKITIKLRPSSGTKKPSIEVSKISRNDMPYCDIKYEFRHAQNEDPVVFDLDNIEQERFYRGVTSLFQRERKYKDHFLDIRKQLEDFVCVCWLSVHRHSDESRNSEDIKTAPEIDKKLSSLNNLLVRHFSSLNKKYSTDVIDFQRKTLLSVLSAWQ